jgi:hypothetical protein
MHLLLGKSTTFSQNFKKYFNTNTNTFISNTQPRCNIQNYDVLTYSNDPWYRELLVYATTTL